MVKPKHIAFIFLFAGTIAVYAAFKKFVGVDVAEFFIIAMYGLVLSMSLDKTDEIIALLKDEGLAVKEGGNNEAVEEKDKDTKDNS